MASREEVLDDQPLTRRAQPLRVVGIGRVPMAQDLDHHAELDLVPIRAQLDLSPALAARAAAALGLLGFLGRANPLVVVVVDGLVAHQRVFL